MADVLDRQRNADRLFCLSSAAKPTGEGLTPTALASLMAAGKELGDILGDGEISAFLGDAGATPAQYVYAVHGYKPAT